jgi:hypothetical protein
MGCASISRQNFIRGPGLLKKVEPQRQWPVHSMRKLSKHKKQYKFHRHDGMNQKNYLMQNTMPPKCNNQFNPKSCYCED